MFQLITSLGSNLLLYCGLKLLLLTQWVFTAIFWFKLCHVFINEFYLLSIHYYTLCVMCYYVVCFYLGCVVFLFTELYLSFVFISTVCPVL